MFDGRAFSVVGPVDLPAGARVRLTVRLREPDQEPGGATAADAGRDGDDLPPVPPTPEEQAELDAFFGRLRESPSPWATVEEATDEIRRRPNYYRRRYGWDLTDPRDLGQHGKPFGENGDVGRFPDFAVPPGDPTPDAPPCGERDAADRP